MFLFNKYTKWYFSIINRSNSNHEIVEKHHIIPKSLGRSNRKENIVCLTPKEHFVCHWLLTKMTFGENRKKMCYAFWSMTRKNKNLYRSCSCLEYSTARKYFVSIRKGKTHEEIYGKEKAEAIKKSLSKSHKGLPKPHAIYNLPKENMSSKIWHITFPDGKEKIIKNLAEFCRNHNLNQGNLTYYKKAKGYKVKLLGKASEISDGIH